MHELLCVQHYFSLHGFVVIANNVYEKSNLYVLIGIRMPSLPVTNLNSHISVSWLLLSWVLQLRLIWQYKSWNLLILLHQIPMLQLLHLHYFDTCHEQPFFIVISDGLSALASAYFLTMVCFYIVNISCHILGIFWDWDFHSIYSLWTFLPCWILLCQMYCCFVYVFS